VFSAQKKSFTVTTEFSAYIYDEFYSSHMTPARMDELWASAWRHFGTNFYRYNLGFYEYDVRDVIPLRIRLADFKFSKSQRRVLNRNRDLQTIVRPVLIDAEKENLFERHKRRFKSGTPDSICDFISADDPHEIPCEANEVCVFDAAGGKLLAASFFDLGAEAVSSVYAMFEPAEERRRLGIFTLLLEIKYALENEKKFCYLGYAYVGNSFYDYKKRFSGLESYDWKSGAWEKFEESGK
jgi:leucyl-tRNA---protein transferase